MAIETDVVVVGSSQGVVIVDRQFILISVFGSAGDLL